jgi:hypothetical protein
MLLLFAIMPVALRNTGSRFQLKCRILASRVRTILALILEDELSVNAMAIPLLRFEKGSSHEQEIVREHSVA